MGGALPSGCNNYPWKNIYIFYNLIFTWMMEPKYVTRGWRLYGMQILFVYFLYYTFCSTNYMYLTFFFILNFNYFIRKVKKYVTRKKNICIHLYVFQTVSIKSTFFFPRHTTFFNMNKTTETKNIAFKWKSCERWAYSWVSH